MLNSPLEQFNIISMCGVKPPVSDGIFILRGVFCGNPASAVQV